MRRFAQALQLPCISYLKKILKVLSIAIYKYKRIKTDLMLNLKHLRKSIKLLKELTRTLYNKKLRNKEKKRYVGALKDILIEKMSDSLKHFTSRNITL